MTDKKDMVYRQSTLAYVTDGDGKFLLVQKEIYKDTEWSFAGGGVDEGETPRQAVARELEEELGSIKFRVVGESKQKYSYDFPEETVKKNYEKRGVWQRGQEITCFWVEFEGNKEELSPVDGIRKIKWVSRERLRENLVFPGQWENASSVIEEFEK